MTLSHIHVLTMAVKFNLLTNCTKKEECLYKSCRDKCNYGEVYFAVIFFPVILFIIPYLCSIFCLHLKLQYCAQSLAAPDVPLEYIGPNLLC